MRSVPSAMEIQSISVVSDMDRLPLKLLASSCGGGAAT